MKAAILIFANSPVPFDLKTNDGNGFTATEIESMNFQLLMHACYVCSNTEADKFVFCKNEMNCDGLLNKTGFRKYIQRGRNTGEIIMNAFETVFALGYNAVVAVNCDSIEIESLHIRHALENLKDHDVVIGPSKSGGYYLIGLTEMQRSVFKNKLWHTSMLLKQTLDEITKLRLTYHLQHLLCDVDEEKENYLLQHRQ